MSHREPVEAFMAGVLPWMSACWRCVRALPLVLGLVDVFNVNEINRK